MSRDGTCLFSRPLPAIYFRIFGFSFDIACGSIFASTNTLNHNTLLKNNKFKTVQI